MRYLVIVNPTSGRGYAEKAVPSIEDALKANKLDYDLVRTERPWHAAEIAEQAAQDGYDVVVTASGDGTANEALNGLMRAQSAGFDQTALGIIPVGTGNDLAYGMGIPDNISEACLALAQNKRLVADIGFVKGGDYPEGRYFGNGVGIGFDAAVGFQAEKITWARGLLAYLIAAMQTVFLYFKAPIVDITFNGETLTKPSLMISIMNGKRMGGGFYMTPDSSPSDGELDLCIVNEAPKLRIFQLIGLFLKGTQANEPEITTGRTKNIIAKATQGTLPAHCDGETLCHEGQQLEIGIIHQALEFVTA